MATNFSFPIGEVLKELMDTSKSLAQPLFKLGQFARFTKNKELLEYVNNELNGYKSYAEIPSYRKGRASIEITVQSMYGKENLSLPLELIEPTAQYAFKYVFMSDGIASIEHLTERTKSSNTPGSYMMVPMGMLHYLQKPAHKLYKTNYQFSVIAARLSTNPNKILEIPNAIRTKLLDFVNSIAEEFGYDIEIDTFNVAKEINNQTINNFMGTSITNSGDGNVINTGDHNQIGNSANISKGNKEQLQSELKKLGIEEEDIAEIVEIVSVEKPNREKGLLGPKANSWITDILGKSLNGIGKLASGISVELLASLLKQFVGLP